MGFVRFSSLSNCSESGSASVGWTYTRTGAGNFTVNYAGGSDNSIRNGGSGQFIFVYAAGIPNSGLNTNNTANDASNWLIGCYSNGIGSPYVFVISGAFDTAADTNVNAAVGDWIRFARLGSTLTVSVSQNSGSTWTTIRTSTGFTTAEIWPHLNFNTDAGAAIGPTTAIQDALAVRRCTADDLIGQREPVQCREPAFAVLDGGRTPPARARAASSEALAGADLTQRRAPAFAVLDGGRAPPRRLAARAGQTGESALELPQRRMLPAALQSAGGGGGGGSGGPPHGIDPRFRGGPLVRRGTNTGRR